MKKTTKSKKTSAKKSKSKVRAMKARPAKRIARKGSAKSAAKATPTKKPPAKVGVVPEALYVYGITEIPAQPVTIIVEGVDGKGRVEAIADGKYLCWASRVDRQEFALDLQKNMEDLEWLAACSIRHQKVLQEIGASTQVLPARFGTVFLTPQTLLTDFRAKVPKLAKVFRRIAGADEWGVKIFGIAPPRVSTAVNASSGVDYLRQKSAELQSSLKPRQDEAIVRFGEELGELSTASVGGGKASSGQPGLLWSASFLVKRESKARFDEVLKRYAAEWAGTRRIDVSGPWPPYSFVSESH